MIEKGMKRQMFFVRAVLPVPRAFVASHGLAATRMFLPGPLLGDRNLVRSTRNKPSIKPYCTPSKQHKMKNFAHVPSKAVRSAPATPKRVGDNCAPRRVDRDGPRRHPPRRSAPWSAGLSAGPAENSLHEPSATWRNGFSVEARRLHEVFGTPAWLVPQQDPWLQAALPRQEELRRQISPEDLE